MSISQTEYERLIMTITKKDFMSCVSNADINMQMLFGKRYNGKQMIGFCRVINFMLLEYKYPGSKVQFELIREFYRRKNMTLYWCDKHIDQINELLRTTHIVIEFTDNTSQRIHPLGTFQKICPSKQIKRIYNEYTQVLFNEKGEPNLCRDKYRSHHEKMEFLQTLEKLLTQQDTDCLIK